MNTTTPSLNRCTIAVLLLMLCGFLLIPQQSYAQQQLLLQGSQVYFVKNNGQVFDTKDKPRPDVEYIAESNGIRLFFTREGVSYVFVEKAPKKEKKAEENRRHQSKNAPEVPSDSYVKEIKTHKVEMKIVDANPSMTILANQQADHYCNYYLPRNRGGAIERVPVFRKLVYQNVYKNIDLVFYSAEQGIKYDLVVRPGGRVEDIRLKYHGATKLEISQKGALRITTSLGALEEHKPLTFQKQDTIVSLGQLKKKRKTIKSSFRLNNDEITFNVESFNKQQTLVIDPGVQWFTYIGGSSNDVVSSNFSVDPNGDIVVRGITSSINFPVTTTASQTTLNGSNDAFIAKFTRAGKRLWATYYGGNSTDGEYDWAGAAVDSDGNVYITGSTSSSSGFPVTSGAFQQTYGGGTFDGYLAKLNSSGIRVWATYFGGSNRDDVFGISIDSEGNIVIAGETSSPNLAVSSGAYQSAHAGYYAPFAHSNSDGFIAKFSGSGQRLWCTYLGAGNIGFERVYAVDCDKSDNVVVVGITPGVNFLGFPVVYFPLTSGAFQTSFGGGTNDAFIAKFSKTGSMVWSTFYGGSSDDYATGVSLDQSNGVVVVGASQSSNFPVSSGAYQTSHSSGYDAFIVKLDSNGSRLWATNYGGSSEDYANDVTTSTSNTVWVTGFAASSNFPVTSDAYQSTNKGGWDAFVLKFSDIGQRQWATLYGGSGTDNGCGIELDHDNPVVVGYTASTTLSVSALTFQPTLAGGYDGFIVRFGSCTITAPVLAESQPLPSYCPAPNEGKVLDAGEYASYLWSNGATTRTITVDQDGTYWVIVADDQGCTAVSNQITIDVL